MKIKFFQINLYNIQLSLMRSLKILILFVTYSVALHAQTINPNTRVGIVLDQDYFLKFVKPSYATDRNYTMGLGLIYQDKGLGGSWFFAPHRFIAKNLFSKILKDYDVYDASIMLANTTFTPEYLGNLHDPVHEFKRENDRPFASLNVIGTSLGLQDNSGNELITLGINVGAIGLNVSKAVQTKIHRDHWFGNTADIPYGWEGQISKGGEPTLLVTGKKDWLLIGKREGTDVGLFQLNTSAEVRLGYYVSTGLGLNTRLGLLDKKSWAMNTLPMANLVGITSENKNLWEVYLLSGVKGNGWLYNALLLGQFRDSPYTISFKQLNKATLDWNLGLGAKIPTCGKQAIRLSAMAVGRSPEFNTVREFKRWHSWVSFQAYYEW
ncbi:lipid A-modifier LpxR family protein [Pedobacter sp. KACC 23697]|uniref:Lipid A-modifier LpxR family protein n=1 Tax=Pedobacter sp. KACC 23697 TaxID=3149230 RepID=A0AAU7K453_9SPHI